MDLGNNQSLTDLLGQSLDVTDDVMFDEEASQALLEANFAEEEQYAYMLGQIAFLFPADELSEVLEEYTITHLPKMPKQVLGLCNVRGNLVPVFDMHGFLDVERVGQNQKLLTIGAGEDMVGVLLDDMPFRVNRNECKALTSAPVLPASLQPYVSQVYIRAGQVILDYRHEELFESLCH